MSPASRILSALALGSVAAIELATRIGLSPAETHAATVALLDAGQVVEVWHDKAPPFHRRHLALPTRQVA